jgi:hypothetical protein
MRKILVAGSVIATHLVVVAGAALAEGGSTVPGPDGGDQVKGVVVHAPDGTAFTGADLGIWVMAAIALLVIGGVLFVAGRRRMSPVR